MISVAKALLSPLKKADIAAKRTPDSVWPMLLHPDQWDT